VCPRCLLERANASSSNSKRNGTGSPFCARHVRRGGRGRLTFGRPVGTSYAVSTGVGHSAASWRIAPESLLLIADSSRHGTLQDRARSLKGASLATAPRMSFRLRLRRIAKSVGSGVAQKWVAGRCCQVNANDCLLEPQKVAKATSAARRSKFGLPWTQLKGTAGQASSGTPNLSRDGALVATVHFINRLRL
jgi:hypothetical protein